MGHLHTGHLLQLEAPDEFLADFPAKPHPRTIPFDVGSRLSAFSKTILVYTDYHNQHIHGKHGAYAGAKQRPIFNGARRSRDGSKRAIANEIKNFISNMFIIYQFIRVKSCTILALKK